MPECGSHTDAVRIGSPVSVGSVTLLPIEHVVLHAGQGGARAWISASKEPYALIVRDAGGVRAIDTDAVALSLEALCEKLPGLDSVLAAMRAPRQQ